MDTFKENPLFPRDPRVPAAAKPIGCDFDTMYYESEDDGFVYVVQGPVVLRIPRAPHAPLEGEEEPKN